MNCKNVHLFVVLYIFLCLPWTMAQGDKVNTSFLRIRQW